MRARLTREGLRFILLLGIVAFAAYNTRNNLIFLMLSVGIAAIVVDFLAGWLSLRRITVEPGAVEDVYARVPFVERLRARNGSAWLHGFGLSFDEGASYLPFLPRGESAACAVSRLFPERGYNPMPPVILSTRYPLGVFRFERRLEMPRRLLVFPEVRPVDPAVLTFVGAAGAGTGGRPGGGDEFFRLRGYGAGDPVHHIHWRTTAKVGELMVRELGDAREDRLALAFLPEPGGSKASFERLVMAAASVARYLDGLGRSFRFIAPEAEIAPRPGPENLRAVLSYLALVEPSVAGREGWRGRLARATAAGETVIVLGASAETLESGPGPGDGLRLVTPERVLQERSA